MSELPFLSSVVDDISWAKITPGKVCLEFEDVFGETNYLFADKFVDCKLEDYVYLTYQGDVFSCPVKKTPWYPLFLAASLFNEGPATEVEYDNGKLTVEGFEVPNE